MLKCVEGHNNTICPIKILYVFLVSQIFATFLPVSSRRPVHLNNILLGILSESVLPLRGGNHFNAIIHHLIRVRGLSFQGYFLQLITFFHYNIYFIQTWEGGRFLQPKCN
jgi:hypothetical protein